MAHARTQKGAQERVAKKRFLRRSGYEVSGEITNKDLNSMIKGKGFNLKKELKDLGF